VPANTWALQGEEARRAGRLVMTRKTIGFFGYYAGPQVYVVDFLALSDPLLARIPRVIRKRDGRWRPGHFQRELPPGYLATLRGNAEGLENPDLDRYLDELRVVVRGPLFTSERWKTIGRFLTRRNAELLTSYLTTLD
jgi:arabinofuranosyltransferase